MLEEKMLEMKKWAVVGANQKSDKYGNMIYKKLKLRGYEVYPVNPFFDEIEGDICYKNLTAIPEKPEVIDMVVGPDKARSVIEEAAMLGIEYIWFQPGTYNDEVLDLAKRLGLKVVQACVLVATR